MPSYIELNTASSDFWPSLFQAMQNKASIVAKHNDQTYVCLACRGDELTLVATHEEPGQPNFVKLKVPAEMLCH